MGEATRQKLRTCLHHLAHVLPGQAPIRDFVHHNTLHGFQHLKFPAALRAARQLTGASGWLPEARSRALLREGRIAAADLDAALRRHGQADMDELVARAAGKAATRFDIVRAALVEGIAPVDTAALAWWLENGERDDDLWAACAEFAESCADAGADDPETLWARLRGRVGHDWTLRELLRHLTGEDALETVRPTLIRHLSAHLDQGLAAWANPLRSEGFYTAWKDAAARDVAWNLAAVADARREIGALPVDAYDAVALELFWLGLPEDHWGHYLERLALELPGWSGMFLWRDGHANFRDGRGVPVAMIDYLAARLTLERLVTQDIIRRHFGLVVAMPVLDKLGERLHANRDELVVRDAINDAALPEHLLGQGQRLVALVRGGATVAPDAWWSLAGALAVARSDAAPVRRQAQFAKPLYDLCRALGWNAGDLAAAGAAGARALLAELTRLDADDRGYIWLCAYERNYREKIFAALAANHGRGAAPAQPSAQIVFCMDDREEGMRRHLEFIAPEIETLGGAAHFGVFQNWRGIDDEAVTPLCPVVPVVVVPAHEVVEQPRTGEEAHAVRRQGGRARLARWADHLFDGSRRGLIRAPLFTALFAPFALVSLLAKSFAPSRFAAFNDGLRARVAPPVATCIDLAAADAAGPATPETPRLGFTDAESAERLFNYLTNLGLTRNFAPLVVIMGHGSNSENNPHLAAYDCGACAGRHSGPNARLFAGMANRAGVRRQLAARGIVIPDGTWFLGAEHNTCDDGITWYDTEDIPADLRAAFATLDAQLDQCARVHAQERCRRLASAPLGITPDAALRHVQDRRHDFSQARPELGHATNACAFIGRRSLSRNAFFDRRSFLISYDPTQDAQGAVLERHLLTNGAVGAGISLEYYFSTANNEQYGCGTKIVHNLAGLMGVMEGASSDLRTGLPRQMIEIHEAMRLLVVIEHKVEIVTAIYLRQPPLQELVGNGWLVVAVKDPDDGNIQLFDPELGWQPWQGAQDDEAPPTVRRWPDWFAASREPLPPALLEIAA